MKTKKSRITPQSENFSKWYLDVVKEAELAENSEVRGCGIVRPYGFKIWELIKKELSRRIEATGVENVYFPLFIPMENLQAEKDHVEGFSPELAVVTYGGGERLANQLAVRPTSETSMYKTYAKWIQSHKDLPMRLNQWNNVVRWEKRPRPFLRWSEFLWQEGHTAFASKEEAVAEMWQMLDIYKQMYEFMAIPVIEGKKSDLERFAGAEITSTVEIMVRDGKAIQGATSHYLGTNFAKVFDITYTGEDEQQHLVHQNSWGFTWRSIGALIMAHGDDRGLRLSPGIAPFQVVVVPILGDDEPAEVLNFCNKIKDELEEYRVKVDDRKEHSGYGCQHQGPGIIQHLLQHRPFKAKGRLPDQVGKQCQDTQARTNQLGLVNAIQLFALCHDEIDGQSQSKAQFSHVDQGIPQGFGLQFHEGLDLGDQDLQGTVEQELRHFFHRN